MAGLLAGCRPTRQPTATPVLSEAEGPTIAPPAEPSTVVRAHHTGVWNDDILVPEAIRQMLGASITALTGLDNATEAWASLFKPGERIAIKVNTIAAYDGGTSSDDEIWAGLAGIIGLL